MQKIPNGFISPQMSNFHMALWKASDHGIVEGRGGSVNKELEFRSWHCGGKGGSLNKKFDFRSWHCGRQAN